MSIIYERTPAENAIDSHDQAREHDANIDRRSTEKKLVHERKASSSSPVTYPSRQEPNEQFYCTDSKAGNSITDRIECLHEVGPAEKGDQELTRQAAEVAAAARFISKVDVVSHDKVIEAYTVLIPTSRLGSMSSVRDSILDGPLNVPKSRATKMQSSSPTKRSKAVRPPPLQLDQVHAVADDIPTPLPTRTSSKGAPSFDIARPVESVKQHQPTASLAVHDSAPKNLLPILTPESANTFQFDFPFTSESSEPRLSRSASAATTESRSPPTPVTRVSEDQIRRDIEAFALEQGPWLRASQRRTRRAPKMGSEDENPSPERDLPLLPQQEENASTSTSNNATAAETEAVHGGSSTSPGLQRKKSIFGWLQKKTEVDVDELIDLYLTDEQRDEVKTVRRKPSRSRLNLFRNRITTDPLPIKGG